MFYFHRHHRQIKTTTELGIIRLILSVGISAISSIWVLYLSNLGFSNSMIGFISGFVVFISFISSFFTTVILEKFTDYKSYILSLIMFIFAYIFMGITKNFYVFIFFAIVIAVANVLRIDSFDILFRDESRDTDLNGNEGMLYSLVNLGWLLGPFTAGYFLSLYGMSSVFFVSSFFIFMSLILFLMLNIKKVIKKRKSFDSNIILNVKEFFSNFNLVLPFLMSCGGYVWWSFVFIYVPMIMIDKGLSYETVAGFLGIVMVPLVLMEYGVGKLSEKYGFRKFYNFGFFLLTFLIFIAFFVENIYFTLALILAGSFAIACVEPLQDTYFFRQVKKVDEEKFYPIFATSEHVGGILGKVLIAVFLLFFSLEYIYLLVTFFMGSFAYFTLKIKD